MVDFCFVGKMHYTPKMDEIQQKKDSLPVATIEMMRGLHYNLACLKGTTGLCRGEMMKNKICLLIFLAMAAFLLAEKFLFVQVLRSQLLAKPDFLSRSLTTLSKGSRLELIETKDSWYLVKNVNGLKGYIHRSAVMKSKSSLSGAVPYKKGASDEELALAAKGFNEGNEKKLRGSREYDFAAVDWVLEQDVPHAAVADFVREGKLK